MCQIQIYFGMTIFQSAFSHFATFRLLPAKHVPDLNHSVIPT